MADLLRANLDQPNEVIEFPNIKASLVELGDLTVGLFVSQPGWRWSLHNKPKVGGEWCQARHIGVVLSGRLGIDFSDGTTAEFGRMDLRHPAGPRWLHGRRRTVRPDRWSGIRTWAGFPTGVHSRVLRTLLFTDIVGSTEIASRLGDTRWRELLSSYLEKARLELERYGGREVTTTGDGMLATFDGPARALHCAAAIRAAAYTENLAAAAPVSTSARWSSSETMCAGWPCTRRRASWPRPRPTRYSSPTSPARSLEPRAWSSKTVARGR